MKAFVGWVLVAVVSIGLGLALYSTSLRGATAGYQEAVYTPQPTSTVIKTRTKVVRKPAKTRIVYVPQTPAAAPQAPAAVPQPQPAVRTRQSKESGESEDSDD